MKVKCPGRSFHRGNTAEDRPQDGEPAPGEKACGLAACTPGEFPAYRCRKCGYWHNAYRLAEMLRLARKHHLGKS